MTNDFITRAWFLDHIKPGDCYVMRGAAGSGKSTLVAAIKERAKKMSATMEQPMWVASVSADEFRMVDGVYVFKAEENGITHGKCLKRFISLCTSYLPKYDILICDNTNIQTFEAAPYVAVAAAYGYTPCIVNIECDPDTAANRNLHGVPAQRVRKMAEQYRRAFIPGTWDQVTIIEEK